MTINGKPGTQMHEKSGQAPGILEVHTGRFCPLRCVFCYRRGATYERSDSPMLDDRLSAVLREFAALGGREVWISGGLEPFSCPETTCRVMVEANRLGLRVRVYSNAVVPSLSSALVRTTVATYAHQVRWSIHSITEKTFRAIERPSDPHMTLRRAIRNVEEIASVQPLPEVPRTGIGFLALPGNVSELVLAAEFWRDRVDFFDVRADVLVDHSDHEAVRSAVALLRQAQQAGRLGSLEISVGEFLAGPPRFAPVCYAARKKVVVDPFGLVWVCCSLAHPGLRPPWARAGNLAEETLCTIIERIEARLPLPHCRKCCAGEAAMNLRIHRQ
jgi:hypothetical protein